MRVVLFSNYINHHQIPLAKAFGSIPGVDYTFVATTPFNSQRAAMGYEDANSKYDFILRAYENPKQERQAHQLSKEADIVLVGSAPDIYMAERLDIGKVTFHIAERYFKKGMSIKTFPRYFASAMKHIRPFQNKPLYYLCSSAYTAKDVNTFCDYTARCFKWAYFTALNLLNEEDLINNRKANEKPIILWVGRFISLKHPDAAIRLASRLRKQGLDFQMVLIGGGDMESSLKMMAKELNIEDNVRFLGYLPPEAVRSHMESADIFLFTSDFNEGWGAVLNEAMSSGCAVIASHAAGAAPFLIRDGANGYLYQSGDENHLFAKTKELIINSERRYLFGLRAYYDLYQLWNADVAANRLIELNNAIAEGLSTDLFSEGPCSPAEILKENWFS